VIELQLLETTLDDPRLAAERFGADGKMLCFGYNSAAKVIVW
jgi:hypothetical protein